MKMQSYLQKTKKIKEKNLFKLVLFCCYEDKTVIYRILITFQEGPIKSPNESSREPSRLIYGYSNHEGPFFFLLSKLLSTPPQNPKDWSVFNRIKNTFTFVGI